MNEDIVFDQAYFEKECAKVKQELDEFYALVKESPMSDEGIKTAINNVKEMSSKISTWKELYE